MCPNVKCVIPTRNICSLIMGMHVPMWKHEMCILDWKKYIPLWVHDSWQLGWKMNQQQSKCFSMIPTFSMGTSKVSNLGMSHVRTHFPTIPNNGHMFLCWNSHFKKWEHALQMPHMCHAIPTHTWMSLMQCHVINVAQNVKCKI
jgi:hypothetical protein